MRPVLGAAALLLLCSALSPGVRAGEPPASALALVSVALPPESLEMTGSRGRHPDCTLRVLGGLVVNSADERFGGYSGIEVDPETGALLLISDYGLWASARIRRDAAGRLAGLEDAITGRLNDRAGAPLSGKQSGDAESARFDGPERLLVSFERDHRIDAFDVTRSGGLPRVTGPAHPIEGPAGFASLDANSGIEALAVLPGGDLLAIAEAGRHAAPGTPAWLRSGGRWIETRYSPELLHRPTDAAALGDGSVVVLERRFDPATETLSARLAVLDAAGMRRALPGRAGLPRPRRLCAFPPQPFLDNVEGIATYAPDAAGRATRLLMISDDNRNPKEKTILFEFDIGPASNTRQPAP